MWPERPPTGLVAREVPIAEVLIAQRSSVVLPSRVLSPDSPPLLRPTNMTTAEGLPPRRAPVRRHPLGITV
ncbi:MAG: hypothetical protein AB1806_02750, partial [Acidobacteriota bacterium]